MAVCSLWGCRTDSHPDGDCNPDRNPDPDGDPAPDGNPDPDSDSVPDCDLDPDKHPHSDQVTARIAAPGQTLLASYTDFYFKPHPDPDLNLHPDPNSYPDPYPHLDSYANAYSHAYAGRNGTGGTSAYSHVPLHLRPSARCR